MLVGVCVVYYALAGSPIDEFLGGASLVNTVAGLYIGGWIFIDGWNGVFKRKWSGNGQRTTDN
jgi:hypothetical protein